MPSKGKRQNSSGTSTSRAVKRRRQENPEPQSESESGPEVGTRPPPSSEVRIRETIDLKKGSFVKRQRFVNGELVEETVEELDSDEAKAALKKREAEADLIRQELQKAFKEHQKVWKRLLQAPHHMFKANTGWFTEGFEDGDDDAVDLASDIVDDPFEALSRSVGAPSHRARPTSRK